MRVIYTIITRHSKDCTHKDDPYYKRCQCWKHLRHFVSGVPKTMATKSRTWAGAEDFKREREALDSAPVKNMYEPVSVELREAVKSFCAAKQGENVSAGVVAHYERDLARMCDFMERQVPAVRLVHQVTLSHLVGFRAEWPAYYEASLSRKMAQSKVKGFFKWTVLAYNLPRSPAVGLKAINTEDTVETMPLTPEEYSRLLAAIPECFPPDRRVGDRIRLRMYALVQLMRYGGPAIGDAIRALRNQQANFTVENGVTFLEQKRQKTGTPVRVPLPSWMVDAVKAVKWTGKSTGISVASAHSGYFRKLFAHAKIENGDAWMVSHRLRDTAAVEWLKLGFDLYTVSKLLGHRSIKTTEKHYAKWVTELQRAAEQKLIASYAQK